MAGGGNTDFVINFKAQVKDLKKEIQSLKQFNGQQQKQSKAAASSDMKRERERQKSTKARFAVDEKARKTERAHLQFMTREESKRHRTSLGQIQTQSKQQAKLIRENERLKKQAAGGKNGANGGGTGKNAFFGGVTGAAVGTALVRAGMGLANFFIGGVQAGYQNYIQYGQAKGRTAGLGSGKSINRGINGAMGSRLGFSKTDTASMVPVMARSTGETAPREMQQAMRATGSEAGEVGDVFSTIRRAGYDFQGAGKGKQSNGGRQFQQLIAGGMASGLERARLPEYFQGVQKIAEEQRNISTGVIGISDIAKQLTMLGQSGRPGMQGSAGAGILQKFNGALQNPGGGEWGENFVRQAMGFGKPGGSTSFYDSEKMREQGISGPDGAKNIQRIMTEMRKQFGTGQEGNLALRSLTGTSLDQGEQLNKIYNSDASPTDKLAQIEQVMKSSDSLEKQSLDAMKGVGGTAERIATLTDRGIGLGGKYASEIEKMEDMQYKVLVKISESIDAIRDFFMGNRNNKDVASSLKNDPSRDFTAKTPAGAIEDINKMLQRKQADAAKTKGPTGFMNSAYQTAQDWFTGDESMAKQKVLSAETSKRMLRLNRERDAIKYLQSTIGDKFDPSSGSARKYIEGYGQGTDSSFPPFVPDAMLARHKSAGKKKTDSGTVAAPAASESTAADGADGTTGNDGDRNLAVAVHVSSDDARDRPTTVVQKPGTDSKKASR